MCGNGISNTYHVGQDYLPAAVHLLRLKEDRIISIKMCTGSILD